MIAANPTLAEPKLRVMLRVLHPIGDEDIRAPRGRPVAIRFPDQLLPIRAEHRKAVEILVEGDLLLTGAITIDDKKIEIAAMGIVHVGGEDDSLPVRHEIGREIRSAVEGD